MNATRRISALIGTLILILLLVMPTDVFSQGPPPWAPAHGYRAKTRHVYFPDQNMYYDIQRGNYIYFSNGNWSISTRVPSLFVGINLGRSAQIELDFYGDRPQRYNYSHKTKYKGHKQKVVVQKKTVVIKNKGKGHPGKGHGNGK